jgi:hypothetical protein
MRKKLTTKTIDALPPAKGKRYEVRDTVLPGLHVRVSATGGKVWYLATRVDGRMRRIKLGPYPVLSLSDARQRAQGILRDIALGKYAESVSPTRLDRRIARELLLSGIVPAGRDWLAGTRHQG